MTYGVKSPIQGFEPWPTPGYAGRVIVAACAVCIRPELRFAAFHSAISVTWSRFRESNPAKHDHESCALPLGQTAKMDRLLARLSGGCKAPSINHSRRFRTVARVVRLSATYMVRGAGFEPATSGLLPSYADRCAIPEILIRHDTTLFPSRIRCLRKYRTFPVLCATH